MGDGGSPVRCSTKTCSALSVGSLPRVTFPNCAGSLRSHALGVRMSLEEIAEKLNVEKVPTIHGTNRWTAASVRKAFVS